jgi:hypothetical protein
LIVFIVSGKNSKSNKHTENYKPLVGMFGIVRWLVLVVFLWCVSVFDLLVLGEVSGIGKLHATLLTRVRLVPCTTNHNQPSAMSNLIIKWICALYKCSLNQNQSI